jgi:hypothetical protein
MGGRFVIRNRRRRVGLVVFALWLFVAAACSPSAPPGTSECRFDTAGSVFDGCAFAE